MSRKRKPKTDFERAFQLLGMSYRQLEKLTGVSNTVWSKYFNGKQSPTIRRMETIAVALNVNPDALIAAFRQRKANKEKTNHNRSLYES